MIQLYFGNGKGKTTAAIGQAVRAAGRGMQVLVFRFLKNDDSGEVFALSHIPGITLISCEKDFGFSWTMTEEEKEEAKAYYCGLFRQAVELALAGCDLLVLDEVATACSLGFVEETEVLAFLASKPETLEVVMTSHQPPESLKEKADYLTEMVMRRHPFEEGKAARVGIEY